jgi:hypothetical protein
MNLILESFTKICCHISSCGKKSANISNGCYTWRSAFVSTYKSDLWQIPRLLWSPWSPSEFPPSPTTTWGEYSMMKASLTERHGQVVNAPSYSGGPRFKYLSWDWLSWLRFSWFSSVSPGKCWGSTLKLGHGHFLPPSFQFIIHLPPLHPLLHNLSHWKSVVK